MDTSVIRHIYFNILNPTLDLKLDSLEALSLSGAKFHHHRRRQNAHAHAFASCLNALCPSNSRLHAASLRLQLVVSLRLTLARRLAGIRQLQHGRALTFGEIGHQHNVTIGEFQRVVMRGRLVEIDLVWSKN